MLTVYDVSRRETFDNLSLWLEEIERFCPGGGKGTVKLLVGNKVDLVSRGSFLSSHHKPRCTRSDFPAPTALVLLCETFVSRLYVAVRQAEREVSAADGAEWARSKGMLFVEASAKTEKCIQQVFDEVVQKVVRSTPRVALLLH